MLRPCNDRVLVRRVAEPPQVSSVIAIPDCARRDSVVGEVVAVGPGRRLEDGARLPLEVKPGDLVLWGPLNDWDVDGYVLIQEADIRGKLAALPATLTPEEPNYRGM